MEVAADQQVESAIFGAAESSPGCYRLLFPLQRSHTGPLGSLQVPSRARYHGCEAGPKWLNFPAFNTRLTLCVERLAGRPLWFVHIVQAGRPDANDLSAPVAQLAADAKLTPTVALGGRHPRWQQLLLRPELYEATAALDFDELTDRDLAGWNADLGAVLLALRSAETLHFPFGTAYKFGRKLPFARLSLAGFAEEMAKIDATATPNELLPPADQDGAEAAFDVTNAFLREHVAPRDAQLAKLLRTQPLASVLCSGGACRPLYESMLSLTAGIRVPPPADRALMHSNSDTDSAATYEVQFRGVLAAPPTIVLRIPTKHLELLPDGWRKLKATTPLPPCLIKGAKDL